MSLMIYCPREFRLGTSAEAETAFVGWGWCRLSDLFDALVDLSAELRRPAPLVMDQVLERYWLEWHELGFYWHDGSDVHVTHHQAQMTITPGVFVPKYWAVFVLSAMHIGVWRVQSKNSETVPEYVGIGFDGSTVISLEPLLGRKPRG